MAGPAGAGATEAAAVGAGALPRAIADLAFDPALAKRLRRGRGLGHALKESRRTIGALILREAVTRFGRSKLGYLWALIEPLAFLGLFLAIRAFADARVPFGESIAVFLMTGLLTARIVIALWSGISPAITANQAMLTYPLVQPLDTVLARTLLECLTYMMVFIIVIAGLLVLVEADISLDIPNMTGGVLSMLALGASWGMFGAAITALLPSIAPILGVLRLPLFITSGAFLMPALLPPEAIAVIEWNPILHCVEWVRDSFYLDYIPVLDKAYPFEFAGITFAIALTLERVFRLRIATA